MRILLEPLANWRSIFDIRFGHQALGLLDYSLRQSHDGYVEAFDVKAPLVEEVSLANLL